MPDDRKRDVPVDEIRVVEVKEALATDRQDLLVPRGETIELPSTDRALRGMHHWVVARSFTDLQELRLVPTHIDERTFMAAVGEDDRRAAEVAQGRVGAATSPCPCDDAGGSRGYRMDYRSAYREVRRSQHPALADALSKGARRPLRVDDDSVRAAHRWSSRLIDRGFLLLALALFNDIVIEDDATLKISNTQSMSVRDITIGSNGRLSFSGGYIKVSARAVSGPNPVLIPFIPYFPKFFGQ